MKRLAILVASVDRQTADALLDQMPPDEAMRVREAVMQLSDEELDVGDQVIAEFLSGGRVRPVNSPGEPHRTDPGSDAVSTEVAQNDERFSSVRIARTTAPTSTCGDARSSPRASNSFDVRRTLSEWPVQRLAHRLANERPVLTALVAAELPPERAAAFLAALPDSDRASTMEAMTQLGPADAVMLEELLLELTSAAGSESEGRADDSHLMDDVGELRVVPEGRRRLDAILAACDSSLRQRLLKESAPCNEPTADEETARKRATDRPMAAGASLSKPHDEETSEFRAAASTNRARPAGGESKGASVRPDIQFDDLNQLDDRSLARVFREADWPTLMLALTGAEEELIERLARQLTPRAARLLRRRIAQPGPVQLRDIELAQQEIVLLIVDLAAQRVIQLPNRRGFTVAA